MTDAVVFDIDGTLADISHRRHFVATKPKNWKAFFAGLEADKVNEPVKRIFDLFMDHTSYKLILCSGRGADLRERTVKWLTDNNIFYDKLYMRAAEDYRPDDIIKRELHDQIVRDGYKIHLVFDDRDRVVNMWRELGYPCFQVADGNF